MSLDEETPPEYVVGHVEDALARDPRVNEQGLRVRVASGDGGGPLVLVVTGTVATAVRKRAVGEVVAELLPQVRVVDETTVADYPEDGEVEEVR